MTMLLVMMLLTVVVMVEKSWRLVVVVMLGTCEVVMTSGGYPSWGAGIRTAMAKSCLGSELQGAAQVRNWSPWFALGRSSGTSGKSELPGSPRGSSLVTLAPLPRSPRLLLPAPEEV